jgi:hypothetical protein
LASIYLAHMCLILWHNGGDMSDTPAQIIGAVALTIISVVFYFLQEDNPLAMLSVLAHRLSHFKRWMLASEGDKKKKSRNAVSRTVVYLRGLGSVLVTVAALTIYFFFWPAAGMFYAACLFGLLDLWFEKNLTRLAKTAIALGIILGASWFTFCIVLYPAKLETTSSWFRADYPVDTDVSGIKWKPGMSELWVNFHNPTERDYDDVELTMLIPDGFVQTTQSTAIPCSPIEEMIWDIHDSKSNVYEKLFRKELIRYRCDKLPKNASIQFVIAVVNADDLLKFMQVQTVKPRRDVSGLFGPKRKPAWLAISATYRVMLRPHKLDTRVDISE